MAIPDIPHEKIYIMYIQQLGNDDIIEILALMCAVYFCS